MTRAESNIVLFSITLCWASSYIFVKNLPADLSPFAYMTMTSGLAFVILAIVFFTKLRELKGRVLLHSAVLAAIVCFNLVFERLGVSRISASTASFVASLSIVFVPLFLLPLKKKPTKNNMLGIPFILAGLVLTSGVHRGAPLEPGVLYMVAACIFMAVYVIVVDNFTKNDDPLLLGIGQMLWVGVIAFLLWCLEDPRTFFLPSRTPMKCWPAFSCSPFCPGLCLHHAHVWTALRQPHQRNRDCFHGACGDHGVGFDDP